MISNTTPTSSAKRPADGDRDRKKLKQASGDSWVRCLRVLGDDRTGIELWSCKPSIVGPDTANSFRVFVGNGKNEYSMRLRRLELDTVVSKLKDRVATFQVGDPAAGRLLVCEPIRFKTGVKGIVLGLNLNNEGSPPYKFRLFMDGRDIDAFIKAYDKLARILGFAFEEYFFEDVCHAVFLAWEQFKTAKWDPVGVVDDETVDKIRRLSVLLDFEAHFADDVVPLRKGVLQQMAGGNDADLAARELAKVFALAFNAMP